MMLLDNLIKKCEGIDFHCPRCGSLLAATISWPISQCNACGETLLSPDEIPMLVKNREEVESVIAAARELGRETWYESPQSSQWSGPYRHHFMRRVQYIRKVVEEFKRERSDNEFIGLDIGCGDGGNLLWIMEYVSTLYASDYNMVRLLRASKVSNQIRVFWADITDYPTADDSFDLIFFNHVLEHIPDDVKALAEVRRILKPGGLLILGVPNEGAFFWQLAYQLQPQTLTSSDHVHFYTTKDISDKCRQAGFKIKDVHPIGWGFPHWGIDERLRGRRWVDDLFERIGRAVIPSQATSLYILLTK